MLKSIQCDLHIGLEKGFGGDWVLKSGTVWAGSLAIGGPPSSTPSKRAPIFYPFLSNPQGGRGTANELLLLGPACAHCSHSTRAWAQELPD